MDISKWNAIMKSFQDLMGYKPGTTEVLVTKRFSKIGFKDIETISGREEKYLVHILRKRYREISNEIKEQDKKSRSDTKRDNGV
jgi:hypothetical protein